MNIDIICSHDIAFNCAESHFYILQVTQQVQHFEGRQKNATPKGNKFSTPKNYSSQNSTGTNSPATTVIAGYCNSGMYRTPPETPPIQNATFGYHTNFVPSVLYRQVIV